MPYSEKIDPDRLANMVKVADTLAEKLAGNNPDRAPFCVFSGPTEGVNSDRKLFTKMVRKALRPRV